MHERVGRGVFFDNVEDGVRVVGERFCADEVGEGRTSPLATSSVSWPTCAEVTMSGGLLPSTRVWRTEFMSRVDSKAISTPVASMKGW